MVYRVHHLANISHKEWNRLIDTGVLTPKQTAMFIQIWKQTNSKNPKIGHYEYQFNKDWIFVEKVEPHYKTHTLLIDPQLESELQEISNRINTNNLYPKIGKMLGWNQGRDSYDANFVKRKLIDKYYGEMSTKILEYDDEQ